MPPAPLSPLLAGRSRAPLSARAVLEENRIAAMRLRAEKSRAAQEIRAKDLELLQGECAAGPFASREKANARGRAEWVLALLSKMQARAARATEVRELVARVTAVKADGNECYSRGDLSGAVERYEAALALLQRPQETEEGSDEDDLPSVPPRDVASVATLRVDELVPDEFIEGLASLLRAGGEHSDVDQAKDLAVTCCINLAQCAARLERPEDAVRACNVALELDERRGKAWFRRGQARTALGQHVEATKDLSRAAVLLPDSKEVREALEQSTKAALPGVPNVGVVV